MVGCMGENKHKAAGSTAHPPWTGRVLLRLEVNTDTCTDKVLKGKEEASTQ
eukprot:CAMPEP_0171106124 /NCGR_PEP_ID=MMETSP0766_2-20121228/64095_1 /TAXON_ID=439317 /ORGANISM="Gambierdiscus australes, Strain CAWD 149" /LENGTH=50 /DNA_ID=CAMNT_0011567133 /DNA_START=53 /DNA_END=205 /DNA_ORIENTATION=-